MRNDFEQPTIQPFSDAKDNKKWKYWISINQN